MDGGDESDIDMNILSEVVSDILKCEWYCMDRVDVLRSVCLLSEKMMYDLFGITEIKCGSFAADGSWVSGSDSDHMYVVPGINVVVENCNCFDVKMHIFTMALDNCSPGYTRLQVHKLYQNSNFRPDIQSLMENDGGRLFLSSEIFLKTFQYGFAYDPTYSHRNARYYSHGPCLKTTLYKLKRISDKLEYDIAIGLKCHSWPLAAYEWKHRQRFKGWPSQEIVDIITSFPVHVMPIGDYKSTKSSMQWRFAFCKAERELVWNFNNTQFQCYVLMKSICKVKLKPFSPNEMSGYQIKNLLFWISEEYGVQMFTKNNLLHCLMICFDRFKQHILKGSLPHYILRDRNLLARKMDTQTRQRIADEIDKNLEDIFVTIFECRHTMLQSFQFLNTYNGSKRNFVCDVMLPIYYCLMKCPRYLHIHTLLQCSHLFLEMVAQPNDMNKVFAFIGDINSGSNYSNTISPFLLETATRFCFIQMGMLLTDARQIIGKTPEEIDCYVWVTQISFKVGFNLDALSGKLYSVTFALLNNKIDTAWMILFPIMCNTKPFLYSGWNMSKHKPWVLQISYFEIRDIDYMEVNGELLHSYDITFPTNVVHFVPEPIKYELFLLQCTKELYYCVYHPVVYAFYLMFEITRKKNEQMTVQNEILRKLSTFIKKCEGGYDQYRAYNLLGYCYYLCRHIEEAVATFGLSLQEKSDCSNVAVYHLCIVLSEHVTSKAAVV